MLSIYFKNGLILPILRYYFDQKHDVIWYQTEESGKFKVTTLLGVKYVGASPAQHTFFKQHGYCARIEEELACLH